MFSQASIEGFPSEVACEGQCQIHQLIPDASNRPATQLDTTLACKAQQCFPLRCQYRNTCALDVMHRHWTLTQAQARSHRHLTSLFFELIKVVRVLRIQPAHCCTDRGSTHLQTACETPEACLLGCVTMSTEMPNSRNAWITATCATPRAPPPAMQLFGQ